MLLVCSPLACSETQSDACPNGKIPVKNGEVAVEVHDAVGTNVVLNGSVTPREVISGVAEHCNGLLPQSRDCMTYLMVTAVVEPCAERSLQLSFRFAPTDDIDMPVTNEIVDARYRLPLESTQWADWTGAGSVIVDPMDEGTFQVHFENFAMERAPSVLQNFAEGTFRITGTLSGSYK